MLQIDDEICTSSAMEEATEAQQLNQSGIEQILEQREGSKTQKTKPQKLKTSERRRIQNRAAQKTYR
jgi:hypothetical protein